MQWSTYLVFPNGTEEFDPQDVPWYDRPSPTKILARASYKGMDGKRVYCSKVFDITQFPLVGKLLAGVYIYRMSEEELLINPTTKSVISINLFLDALSKIGMRFHKLQVSGTYKAVAVTYHDTYYSYTQAIYKKPNGAYWMPNLIDRNGMIDVSIGNLSSLESFGYKTVTMKEIEEDLLNEMTNLDLFKQQSLSDYYEFETLENDTIPSSVKPIKIDDRVSQISSDISELSTLIRNVDDAIKNLDVSNSDTSNLSELITECRNRIEESLRKVTEQSSQLDLIIEKVENDSTQSDLIESFQSFSARLDTISEYYGTRIFEIEQLKAELSSFYDKAIAAWKESIESIGESLTASGQASSVALDINQALDSLKSNLKRVETLASIFDKASTVSGEISTNAQIVGTAVSTLSSLLLSFNNSVDGYEKTLLSLVENVRQNLDLFLHSSDSVFREARKAVSDSVVTNALSKGLDLINSIKKKETL